MNSAQRHYAPAGTPASNLASNPASNPTRTALRGGGLQRRQRGVTLFGLLFWALLIGFGAYLVIRILPTINEWVTIQRAVEKIAAGQPATVPEARRLFDQQKDLEYSIGSISGKDLTVTKENDKVVISYAYDNQIPVYGPVFILIKYSGSSR